MYRKLIKLIVSFGIDNLLLALSNDDDEVREAAAWVAGKTKNLEAAKLLSGKLRDKNINVQKTSVWALNEIAYSLTAMTERHNQH